MEKSESTQPTSEQIKQWTVRDIEAALYFLSYLRESPDVIDKLVETILKDARFGSKIDTIDKPQE